MRPLRFSRPNRRIASSSVRTAEFKGSPCGPEKIKVISVKKLVYHAQEVRRPWAGDARVKSRDAVRAIAGVFLCATGLWLAIPAPYRERTFLIDAGGCGLETTIVGKPEGGSQGSVLLFHGISANKKIMSYLARGFAEQGLRVYVPDLPGHGRTPGPFSPARAEQCGEALLRELLARGVINADRTILARRWRRADCIPCCSRGLDRHFDRADAGRTWSDAGKAGFQRSPGSAASFSGDHGFAGIGVDARQCR